MNISVALCTYNGSRYLPEQLESYARQARRPDEVVACDDRSTDGTVDVLRAFAARAPFPVRVVVNATNLGSTRNFEQALGLCSGDVIVLSDQDDSWLPERLALTERAFRSGPDVGLVYGDAELSDADLSPLGHRLWESIPFTPRMQQLVEAGAGPNQLLRYNFVTGAAAAFRADLLPIIRPIPGCWVHDGWIAFLAAATSAVRLIPQPVIRYRQHHTQQIGVRPLTLARQFQSALQMGRTHFDWAVTLFTALAERLAAIRGRLRDPGLLSLTAEKVRHTRLRARMRGMSWPARWASAAGELVHGRYHRFGHGWKALLVDLLF